jgi:hypothetical protein
MAIEAMVIGATHGSALLAREGLTWARRAKADLTPSCRARGSERVAGEA